MYADDAVSSLDEKADSVAYLGFLYKSQRSAKVSAQGHLIRRLPEQLSPYRAQLFLVRLTSGQKLIIKHDIEMGEALPDIKKGALLFFKGLYKWNRKGGFIIFTTQKNRENNLSGWLKYKEITYQ